MAPFGANCGPLSLRMTAHLSFQVKDGRTFVLMKRLETARMPTKHGNFVMIAFGDEGSKMPHLALVHQSLLHPNENMLAQDELVVDVRIHSECLTGDVFGSLRCDCGEQLQASLQRLGGAFPGILLYLRQEGRGIGLVSKMAAYNLQDEGHDTFSANKALGHQEDGRNYQVAVDMLNALGTRRVRLLTNNPLKEKALEKAGIVVERVPLEMAANRQNLAYLRAKQQSGHLLSLPDLSGGNNEEFSPK